MEQPATVKGRRDLADEALTKEVIATFAGARNERFREIAESLVRHLHAFATEIGLTEEEWSSGIDFMTRAGQITDDKRQELILLSDVLGLSMLVVGLDHQEPGATESTVFGPFFVERSPRHANGDDIANGMPGTPCYIEGQVTSVEGVPIEGARVEVWQADGDGFYDVQHAGHYQAQGRGHLQTDYSGRFWFWTVKPSRYPIPADGPVGELLNAARRSPMRPAHVHFRITAPGYRTLTTHVFDREDPHLDTDAVFGVRSGLVTTFHRHEPGSAPDGRRMATPFYTLDYRFKLAAAPR